MAEIMLYNSFLVKVTPISSIIRKIRPNLNIKGDFFRFFVSLFCATFLYHFLYFSYHFLDYFLNFLYFLCHFLY
jgi:hypothetical protein